MGLLIATVVRFIIGGHYVWVGSSKLRPSPPTAPRHSLAYHLGGPSLDRLLTAGIPPLQIAAGMLFAGGFMPLVTGGVLIAMILIQALALLTPFARDLNKACGCNSPQPALTPPAMFRLIILFLGATYGMTGPENPQEPLLFVAMGVLGVILLTVIRYRQL